MNAELTSVSCPACAQPVLLAEESFGKPVDCPYCLHSLFYDPGHSLKCPRCGSGALSSPQKQFSVGAGLLFALGCILVPLYGIGLLIMWVAWGKRQTRYQCWQCALWF